TYANPEALISTDQLAARLDDPDLAILEVDEDTTAYEKAHIRGAVGLDWQRDLHAPPRREFVSAADLASLLGSHGVRDGQTIVLYGGNSNWFAAYAYWLFALRGVPNVRLLDGGRKKWELESRPMVTEVATRPATTFSLGSARPVLRVLRDEILARQDVTL